MIIFQIWKLTCKISSFRAWRTFEPRFWLWNGSFLKQGKSDLPSIEKVDFRTKLIFQIFFSQNWFFSHKFCKLLHQKLVRFPNPQGGCNFSLLHSWRFSWRFWHLKEDCISFRDWTSINCSPLKWIFFLQWSIQKSNDTKIPTADVTSLCWKAGHFVADLDIRKKPASASESAAKTATLQPPK